MKTVSALIMVLLVAGCSVDQPEDSFNPKGSAKWVALRANVNAEMNPSLDSIDLRETGSYGDVSTASRRARNSHIVEMMNLRRRTGVNP